MTKKYLKIFYGRTYFFVILIFGFFDLSVKKVLALEVQYPVISGQTITASTGLPSYVKYLFNFGTFLGFFAVLVSLIIAGVMYFLSPVSAQMKADAKDRVTGAISGLLILALTYLIIITINPQLSILSLDNLSPTPSPAAAPPPPGVYFYTSGGNNSGDCSDKSVQPSTSDVADLGPLKNKVNSVGMVQDTANGNGFISILYDAINFQGKCLYLDPNQPCQSVMPFAASANVLKYNPNPTGDGVYFYRKSCFDTKGGDINSLVASCNANSGGYYEVYNNQISGVYQASLDSLQFQNVPTEEQDCVKYDKNGNCAKDGRKPQSLGGENISSIIINGNYFVLLYYQGPQDTDSGPWTSCQGFPTISDVNKTGPQQIKWDNIRNSDNVLPNRILIIPITK